jgi:hypothetical protein
MEKGREAHIIIDASVTTNRPLMELEALAAQAVALLACGAELISATIFCKPATRTAGKPDNGSYWISVSDSKHNIRGMYELKRQAPVVDFEIVNRAVSDIVA